MKDIKQKTSLIIQGSILASAGLISKIIGFFYRLQVTNILGEQGNGIYSVAFGIYSIALTLSSYSLPAALSKIFSQYISKDEHQNHMRAFKVALVYAFVSGVISCLFLFFGASYLEHLYSRSGLSYCLRTLAPATFIVAILGVLRGYFQGYGSMLPTALSQILEQIINAIVSIIAASQFMLFFSTSQNKFAYGAAGSCLGTLMGAACALLLLTILYAKRERKQHLIRDFSVQSYWQISQIMIITVVPIVFSQTVFQLGGTIDDYLLGNILKANNLGDAYISSLQGVYNSQFNLLINLPVSVAVAMGTAMIPSITLLKGANISKKLQFIMKINMVVAVPSAVGLAVFAKPINLLLFSRLIGMQNLSVQLFHVGSLIIIPLSLATLSNSIMYSYNYMKVSFIHCLLSLIMHTILTYCILSKTNLEIFAVLLSNFISPCIIVILNLIYLKKKIGYKIDFYSAILLPFISACIMAAFSYPLYKGLMHLGNSNTLSILLAINLAIFIYFISIIGTKCLTINDLCRLPLVNKFIHADKKY